MTISEAVELSLIKMTLSAAAKAKAEQMRLIFEDIGIQADITFEIDVKGIDLDTLHSKMGDSDIKKIIEE